MDSQVGCGSALPLIWAIEALACSNRVKPSDLLALVKIIPPIPDNIGKNAREWVSLKYLESLFIEGARAFPVPSALSKTVRLDPSENCEEVLRRILIETSYSHLKPAGPEITKWDLEPFIEHKKSNLPRCNALKQLKDAILAGSPSISSSLKERSGLLVGSHSEHQAPAIDGNCNGITPRVEGSDTDDTEGGKNEACYPQKTNEDVDRFELYTKNVDDVEENVHISDDKDGNDDGKTDIASKESASLSPQNSNNQDSLQTTSRYQNLLADTSQRCSEERCSLEEQTCVEVMRQNGSPGDGDNQCDSSKGLVRNVRILPHSGTGVLNEKIDVAVQNSKGEITENGRKDFHGLISTNEDIDKFDLNVPRTVPTVGEAEDVNISSDNDGYDDERATIDAKKKTFLSSQGTYNQDSLMTDCRELHLCMKCNKGGNVLSCTSDSCPIVIHEICLGSDASFDTRETFYCPFCAYSRAISKYMEVQKCASSARKDLTTFLCLGPQNESNKQSRRSFRIGGDCLKQNDCLPKGNELNQTNVVEKVNNHQCRKKLEYEQAGPSELRSDYSPPFGSKVVESTDRLVQSSKRDKQDGKRMREESQPPRGRRRQPIAEEEVHNSQRKTTSCQVFETSESEKHGDVRSKKGVQCPPETDLPCDRKCSRSSQSTDAEEISEDEDEDSGTSKYFIKVRKKERQNLYPAIPQLRRKRIPWKSEEEDTLKKGMHLFSSPHKSIQWKKILEFGEGIFQPSRSTMDLKDKWRNMCKASPKKSK